MTVAMLMYNTFESAQRHWANARDRKIVPLKLNLLEKVPRFVLLLFDFKKTLSEPAPLAISRLRKLKCPNALLTWRQKLAYNLTKWKATGSIKLRSNLVSLSDLPTARMANISSFRGK